VEPTDTISRVADPLHLHGRWTIVVERAIADLSKLVSIPSTRSCRRCGARRCGFEPPLIDTALAISLTVTGSRLGLGNPFPSWPTLLAPQHRTVASTRSAQLWSCPVVTAIAGD
jgi:hypothetical protein